MCLSMGSYAGSHNFRRQENSCYISASCKNKNFSSCIFCPSAPYFLSPDAFRSGLFCSGLLRRVFPAACTPSSIPLIPVLFRSGRFRFAPGFFVLHRTLLAPFFRQVLRAVRFRATHAFSSGKPRKISRPLLRFAAGGYICMPSSARRCATLRETEK